jgi:hypothetical protein
VLEGNESGRSSCTCKMNNKTALFYGYKIMSERLVDVGTYICHYALKARSRESTWASPSKGEKGIYAVKLRALSGGERACNYSA